ncbi:MAG: DUF488 domain-containing protein [Betaproteobacteria bacterium]|nr:DUF488 domain-containing protein [Betaproteobacteria bacterium]
MNTHPAIHTVGHGNRSGAEFLALLGDARIEALVDVRAYPGSRRHPQFAREALERSLAEAGVRYLWEGTALGGRRRPAQDSPHVALRNEGFRAYADHMMSQAFRQGLDRVLAIAGGGRTAIMCAERLPWQCHRWLIADYLVTHAVRVLHIIAPGEPREHVPARELRVVEGRLVYDYGNVTVLPLP